MRTRHARTPVMLAVSVRILMFAARALFQTPAQVCLEKGSREVSAAAAIPAYRRLLRLPWLQRRPSPAGTPLGAMLWR